MKRTAFLLSLLLFLTCSLVSCRAKRALPFTEVSFLAMDTVITLRLPADTPNTVSKQCEERTLQLEQLLSRTVERSEISRFNLGTEALLLSDETKAVLETALSVAMETNGAYDPTVAPLSLLWDIASQPTSIPSEEKIASALDDVGYAALTLSQNLLTKKNAATALDLGGCAKGYACAESIAILKENGLSFGIVSFGGNIGVFGAHPDGGAFRIGVKDPSSPNALAGYLTLSDTFVSVSGDYERYIEVDGIRYHHIFDPRTGYPADSGVRSVAVVCDDAVLADTLSTALFVMGLSDGMTLYESDTFDFEALWYLSDGTTAVTEGLSAYYEHASVFFKAPTES